MLRKSALIGLIVFVGLGAIAWVWSQSVTKDQVAPSSALISPIDGPGLLKYVQKLNQPLTMVNFWATWCGPCAAEMPLLIDLYKRLEPKGFRLVLVSIDEPADLTEASEFLKSNGVTFPSFYKGLQPPMFIQSIYPNWQGSVPASLLYGPNLQLLEAWEGDASAEELEQRIARHLKADEHE